MANPLGRQVKGTQIGCGAGDQAAITHRTGEVPHRALLELELRGQIGPVVARLGVKADEDAMGTCLLYTSPSPRD